MPVASMMTTATRRHRTDTNTCIQTCEPGYKTTIAMQSRRVPAGGTAGCDACVSVLLMMTLTQQQNAWCGHS